MTDPETTPPAVGEGLRLGATEVAARALLHDQKRKLTRSEEEWPIVGERFQLERATALFSRPLESQVAVKDLNPEDIAPQVSPLPLRDVRPEPIRFKVTAFHDRWPDDVANQAGIVESTAKLPCYELDLVSDGGGSTERRLYVDAATVQRGALEGTWPVDLTPEEDFAA